MFVYSSKQLAGRLALPDHDGFLSDYWLALHFERTHPLLALRPIGARTLTQIAGDGNDLDPKTDRVLIAAIADELSKLREINPYLAIPLPGAVLSNRDGFTQAAKDWLADARKGSDLDGLPCSLSKIALPSVDKRDYSQMALILRRLAAELAANDKSSWSLFSASKEIVDGDNTRESVAASITTLLTKTEKIRYSVSFPVIPARAPAILRQMYTTKIEEGCGNAAELKRHNLANENGFNFLTEINFYDIFASDMEQAVHQALEKVREHLRWLRLRMNVRTSLSQFALVKPLGSDQVPSRVPLPLLFWARYEERRLIRELPPKFLESRPPDEKARWRGGLDHLSAAIYNWTDDPHSAASFVWQAIEAVTPDSSGWKNNPLENSIVKGYLQSLWKELGYTIAVAITEQARELRRIVPNRRWHYYNAGEGGRNAWAQNLEQWLANVCTPSSAHFYAKWHHPDAWVFIGDQNVGVLPLLWRLRCASTNNELADRLKNDLKLLYGLRNSLVHDGVRRGNQALAMYLARVGMEILFWQMHELCPVHRPRRRRGARARARRGPL
jgi:hypothetical protein